MQLEAGNATESADAEFIERRCGSEERKSARSDLRGSAGGERMGEFGNGRVRGVGDDHGFEFREDRGPVVLRTTRNEVVSAHAEGAFAELVVGEEFAVGFGLFDDFRGGHLGKEQPYHVRADGERAVIGESKMSGPQEGMMLRWRGEPILIRGGRMGLKAVSEGFGEDLVRGNCREQLCCERLIADSEDDWFVNWLCKESAEQRENQQDFGFHGSGYDALCDSNELVTVNLREN